MFGEWMVRFFFIIVIRFIVVLIMDMSWRGGLDFLKYFNCFGYYIWVVWVECGRWLDVNYIEVFVVGDYGGGLIFRYFFFFEDFRKLGIWRNKMLKMNEGEEIFRKLNIFFFYWC